MNHQDPWWELSLTVPIPLAEDLCGLLLFHGALGAELASHALPAPPLKSSAPKIAANQTGILTSFDQSLSEDAVLDIAAAAFTDLGCSLSKSAPTLRKRDDTEWAEAWKSFFKPLSFGERLWIVPRWETSEENEAMLATLPLHERSLLVHLEPGLAFGTGQHATTSLCLQLLEPLLNTPCQRLLDVGCGSGILSIAAAKLGVPTVVGIDNDPLAVRVATENAKQNGTANAVRIEAAPLQESESPFNLVVANIIAPVLIEIAPAVIHALDKRGTLVLSGILQPQWPEVKQTYDHAAQEAGLPPLNWSSPLQNEDWIAVSANL